MDKDIKILLVEDDVSMGFLLVDFLEANRFSVSLVKNGIDGFNEFKNNDFDFCILDIMLPGMDGYTLAENIRKENRAIPVIFLTARNMKVDKIKGFNIGVDDYVTKPFDEDELLCRINAIMNRADAQKEVLKNSNITTKFKIQSYTFDYPNQMLTYNQESRRLTKKESEVLRVLCESKNQIVTRDTLLNDIWGDNNYFNGRSLDVFITKLRKYLNHEPALTIENIPKVGFVLNC